MESYPTDPLEGLDYNYAEDSKCGYEDSLFSEPSWMEASRNYCSQRPTIPSSELGIPQSYSHKKKKKSGGDKDKNNGSSMSSAPNTPTGHLRSNPKKKFTLPENKFQDPKASQLLEVCRSGWTLSKGQKNKPVLGKINLSSVKDDIQVFADRYLDARSKSSASRSTDLNEEEHFRPQAWPNKNTINLSRTNSQMFRAPDSMKSTLGNSTFSFPKDIRMHPEKERSPGPVFDTTSGYEAILTKHSTPLIGAAGRTLAGSIYYDQFNLKSHGNYYHANEAYLNHTSAPAARVSHCATLRPKPKNNSYVDIRANNAKDMKNPMKSIRDIRSGKKPKKGKYA